MDTNPLAESLPYVELHPTNNCIFRCPWCTYLQFKDRERETLPLNSINHVLDLNPNFVLICGGGDPTSYSADWDGTRVDLAGLLAHIRKRLPNSKIQVGTHAGCKTLSRDLLKQLTEASHIGISLGAGYEASRGPSPGHANWDSGAFDRTLENIATIVQRRSEKGATTYVSSTFTRDNWTNLFVLAQALFEKLRQHPNGVHPCDLRVKFGATSIADDLRPHDPYYPSRLTPSDRHNWSLILQLAERLDSDFSKFLRTRTSLRKAPEDRIPSYGITRCGMVQNYVLAAADGHYYPCCVMAARRTCSLGTIADMTPAALARSRQEFRDSGTPPVCAEGCRVKSHTLMGGKAWGKMAEQTGGGDAEDCAPHP